MQLVEQRGDATIIHVREDLDFASAPALLRTIEIAEASEAGPIIVSLEPSTYCYASGLSVLARSHNRIGSKFFVVVPERAQCRRALEVTGLSKLLHIASTLEGALECAISDRAAEDDHGSRLVHATVKFKAIVADR